MSAQEIQIQEITPQQIVELLKKASEAERRYLLELETWARQGTAYEDWQYFEIVIGEADVIKVEDWDEGYPYAKGSRYIVIPKTVPTVVRKTWYDDTQSPIEEGEEIYIFTKDGWKVVRVG